MALASLAGSIGFWPPSPTKRLADEHDAGQPIEQAEFADRVADVDRGVALRPLAARAQRAIEAEPLQFVGDRLRRARDGAARSASARRERPERRGDAPRRRCAPRRRGSRRRSRSVGPRVRPASAASSFRSAGGGARVVFQIADDVDRRRAERGEPLRVALALRQAELDPRRAARAMKSRRAAPALEGARAHPRVDHRPAARRRGAPRGSCSARSRIRRSAPDRVANGRRSGA